MKKVCVFLISILLYSCTTQTEKVVQQTEETQIPILAWHGIPSRAITQDRFYELKETGITHHYATSPNADAVAQALDFAQNAGIKMIIHCPELEKNPEETAKRFKNHPALAGYFLRDEPSREQFPELGEWARRIQSVDSIHFCYLNLFPNYASADALGTETYQQHVNLFIKEVPLQLLSFDHYPIIKDETGTIVLREEYYENLEIFADEARKAGKPFWAFALTVAHDPYPIPTMGELRLQVFSNLAYGAQGIQYFTYWTPNRYLDFIFYEGPIDLETGKRTVVYDRIKEMSREIKNLSDVFLNANVLSIAHTGEEIPKGTIRLQKLPEKIKVLETKGMGAIVSVLEKRDKQFLVIVNRDFKNSLNVKIEGDPSLQRVLKDGTYVPANAYVSTLEVDPGDLLIYSWNK